MAIEHDFDLSFVAGMALREKQIQQSYRPIIAVHKWFARRPGTLFRALLLAEFGRGPIRERFFEANSLKGIRIADPFMGGGTPLFEANRLGCNVLGYDINPMAYWIVRQEIEWLDLAAYQTAAAKLTRTLESKLGHLYRTRCLSCGSESASVKYFLWVKTVSCEKCDRRIDLFPGYIVSHDRRHPRNVFVCSTCGELTETNDRKNPGVCGSCGAALETEGPAKGRRCACPACGTINRYPIPERGAPQHRMFAIEYHCPACKKGWQGRFFKKPDDLDLAKLDEARRLWGRTRPQYVPDEAIPSGDETNRLHRWGYRLYREMFNERQLVALETAARLIVKQSDVRVRNALATNLSDLLRYQNMLCRYDMAVLKSLDIFSVHGFPVGLVQCESNFLGISGEGVEPDLFGEAGQSGGNVGSGGWSNIIDKYAKAKAYCARPFEVRHRGQRKTLVPIPGEWIGDSRPGTRRDDQREVDLRCESAMQAALPPGSLDAVFTDPPYFGNVQYAELMDFCYVWLRRLVAPGNKAFQAHTTRSQNELTENVTMDRGLNHFADGLSKVFQRMAEALKPGSPFAFTYHHNTLEAYFPVAVAILDSGLTCTASLPCPAEMAASIHINGTGSSVVDTIFVCRSTEFPNQEKWMTAAHTDVASLVQGDITRLQEGGVNPTQGDIRCIFFGHLIRLSIGKLRPSWDRSAPIDDRLGVVATWVKRIGSFDALEEKLLENQLKPKQSRSGRDGKIKTQGGAHNAQISF